MKKHTIQVVIILVLFLITVTVFFEANLDDKQEINQEEHATLPLDVGPEKTFTKRFLFCEQESEDSLSCWTLDDDYSPSSKCEAHKQKERDLIKQRQGVFFPGIEGECDYAFKQSEFNGFSIRSFPKTIKIQNEKSTSN